MVTAYVLAQYDNKSEEKGETKRLKYADILIKMFWKTVHDLKFQSFTSKYQLLIEVLTISNLATFFVKFSAEKQPLNYNSSSNAVFCHCLITFVSSKEYSIIHLQ